MPNCLNCGKPVKNKFCSIACQNQYRAKQQRIQYEKHPKHCECCGIELSWEQRRNKYCSNSCAAKINNKGVTRNQKNTTDILEEKKLKRIKIEDKTKGELFNNNKNWQSARSSIRRSAQKIFKKSGKECKCVLCGYNKYVEVAHIKAVSEFDNSSLISEINNINNLIPLCPNHHWEFDNNRLDEKDLNKIKEYSAMDQ